MSHPLRYVRLVGLIAIMAFAFFMPSSVAADPGQCASECPDTIGTGCIEECNEGFACATHGYLPPECSGCEWETECTELTCADEEKTYAKCIQAET